MSKKLLYKMSAVCLLTGSPVDVLGANGFLEAAPAPDNRTSGEEMIDAIKRSDLAMVKAALDAETGSSVQLETLADHVLADRELEFQHAMRAANKEEEGRLRHLHDLWRAAEAIYKALLDHPLTDL